MAKVSKIAVVKQWRIEWADCGGHKSPLFKPFECGR